jgi:hypothetical protein
MDKKVVHRIGWVRASPRFPAKPQIEAIKPLVRALYSNMNDETIADVIKAARKGNEIYVHGIDRLGDSRAEVVAALEALRKIGAKVIDVETGASVAPENYESVAASIGRLNGERRLPTAEIARKRGALGGKPKAKLMIPKKDARAIWRDKDLSNEQASYRIGLHWRTCYRLLGDRGLPAGRKRTS